MDNMYASAAEFAAAYPDAVDLLLADNSTYRNIMWMTAERGDDPLGAADIPNIIPRCKKPKAVQKARTKSKAEVFTPMWVCAQMVGYIDNTWFGRDDVFGTLSPDHVWTPAAGPIVFSDKRGKTWQNYIKATGLEITCGEAPFLCSRYDAATGEDIPVNQRIGMLDRKLRAVTENTKSPEQWFLWAAEAVKSTYGYEWQGDSLLLARVNVLADVCEHMQAAFGVLPTAGQMNQLADIVAWNLLQMDGLQYTIPGTTIPALIYDWQEGHPLAFKEMAKEEPKPKKRKNKKVA